MAFWNRARNKVNTVSQRPDAPTVSVVTQDENFQRLSRLDVEMKREALRAQQLANQRAEQELLALQIENAKALSALSVDQRQQARR